MFVWNDRLFEDKYFPPYHYILVFMWLSKRLTIGSSQWFTVLPSWCFVYILFIKLVLVMSIAEILLTWLFNINQSILFSIQMPKTYTHINTLFVRFKNINTGFLRILQLSSANKTDCHDITEILLKVALIHHKPSIFVLTFIIHVYVVVKRFP